MASQTMSNPLGTPELYDSSISVKVVEVAKKYDEPEVRDASKETRVCTRLTRRASLSHASQSTPNLAVQTPTTPQRVCAEKGSRLLRSRPVETSWTQGFFPGMLWLLVERARFFPESIDPSYSEQQLVSLARRWQNDFKFLARPSINHDQGFRFQLSYGQ